MNWKEKTVIRILLIIAEFMSEGDFRKEIRGLATHISAGIGDKLSPAPPERKE